MKRMLGAGVLLALAAVMPAQQAAAQDPIGGAIVGGALGGIIGGAVGRGAGGAVAGAGDRRHDRRGDRVRSATPRGWLLLVARRLLLPLSERLVAGGRAGLLLLLSLCRARSAIAVAHVNFNCSRRPPARTASAF